MRVFIFILGSVVLCSLFAALPPLLPSLNKRIHEAIESGNIQNLAALLALSTDPNALYLQRTTLQTAVIRKNPFVIGCLFAHGASLSADILERFLKAGNEHYTFNDLLASLQLLLDRGATIDTSTPLPQGYLLPIFLAQGNSDAQHAQITEMIHGAQEMQKIA